MKLSFSCLLFIFFVSLAIPTNSYAQAIVGECDGGLCDDGYFQCFYNTDPAGDSYWTGEISSSGCGADEDEPNCSIAAPSYPICVGESACIIPCTPPPPDEDECTISADCTDSTVINCSAGDCICENNLCKKPWGASCSSATDPTLRCSQSPFSTSCRHEKCLRTINSITLHGVCYADDECSLHDSATNPRNCIMSGESGNCEASGDCDTDQDCINQLGDNRAKCNIVESECYIPTPTPDPIAFDLCKQTGPLQPQCEVCVGTQSGPKHAMWTAVGCIPTEHASMIKSLISFLTAVAGGFTILFILLGAFSITTSAGKPEKIQSGKETITAAIIGLSFIVLSVLLLQVIGVHILQIPGF